MYAFILFLSQVSETVNNWKMYYVINIIFERII